MLKDKFPKPRKYYRTYQIRFSYGQREKLEGWPQGRPIAAYIKDALFVEERKSLQKQVKQLRPFHKQERAGLIKHVNHQFEKLEMNKQHRKLLDQHRQDNKFAHKHDKGSDFVSEI